ncbi:hypothetical protein BCR37DRAFT_386267 [Protomyces lactucae-debilis]|uniref:Uncharacterized protein n=1 Tax=Protomyces lactucae-debilis TaxID=2754530 RepID=A0A1Y2FMV8_PROLT|nr:uncharacterized protein BCR37DRAFT_386267 [Protomyces lactucae-debilis]ORY84917.1 hypothetical protein BCR37DRAFT_386267 [Protomyces lactucae-debilis]
MLPLVLMAYASLLGLFLSVCTLPEPEPVPAAAAVAVRERGSSSGRNANSKAPVDPWSHAHVLSKPEAGSTQNQLHMDQTVSNASGGFEEENKCYHLQFEARYILNREIIVRFNEVKCKSECRISIPSYFQHIKTRLQHAHGCIKSAICMNYRTSTAIEPMCFERREAASKGSSCTLDSCFCSVTVNFWRVKQKSQDPKWFQPTPAGQKAPLCHPAWVMQPGRFDTTRWSSSHVQWVVLEHGIRCDEPLPDEKACGCVHINPGGRACKEIEHIKYTRCGLENPGPDGNCLCDAGREDHCAATTVVEPNFASWNATDMYEQLLDLDYLAQQLQQ